MEEVTGSSPVGSTNRNPLWGFYVYVKVVHMSNFQKLKTLIENNHNSKIVICGNTGSGKSTLGNLISQAFNIPHIETDLLTFRTGWELRPKDEYQRLLKLQLEKSSWIVDGGGSEVAMGVANHATVIIWLDVSPWGSLIRVMRRSIKRRHPKHRSPLGQEKFSEIIQLIPYILRYKRDRRLNIEKHISGHSNLIHIKSWKEVVALMNALKK